MGQQCIGADAAAPHEKAARTIERTAGDFCPRLFLDRQWFAGQHRFVHAAATFNDNAIHRQTLARPHAHHVADLHQLHRHILFAAVRPDEPGCLRRQAEQSADGGVGPSASAQLQHLP